MKRHGRRRSRGHDFIRTFLGTLQRALPDLEVELEILLEREDRVVWQGTLKASHESAFMGFPASGRPHVWRDMVRVDSATA